MMPEKIFCVEIKTRNFIRAIEVASHVPDEPLSSPKHLLYISMGTKVFVKTYCNTFFPL